MKAGSGVQGFEEMECNDIEGMVWRSSVLVAVLGSVAPTTN